MKHQARKLAGLYRKLRGDIPDVKVPSVVHLWFKKHNPFADAYTRLLRPPSLAAMVSSSLEPPEMGRGVVIRIGEWHPIPHPPSG